MGRGCLLPPHSQRDRHGPAGPLDGSLRSRSCTAADLAEAFRWSEHRTVSKTALVSLQGNRYQVDPGLTGRKVELVFDPFDLSFLRVRHEGKDAGTAQPFQVSRHSHPKARPEVPAEPPVPTTGIDYLALVDARHTAELAGKVNASTPSSPNPPPPIRPPNPPPTARTSHQETSVD